MLYRAQQVLLIRIAFTAVATECLKIEKEEKIDNKFNYVCGVQSAEARIFINVNGKGKKKTGNAQNDKME